MKIIHLLYAGLGGHGNVFFSFVNAAGKGKFEYEAIFNGIEPVRKEYIDNCAAFGIPWHYVSKKPGLDLQYYKDIIKHIKESDADIVFIHSSAYIYPALVGAKNSKKRKVVIVRETQANQLKSRMEWLWLAYALRFAAKVVFLSEAYRSEIKRKLSLFYNEKRVSVIPNGLDLKLFGPSSGEVRSTAVVGMQSRLVKNKDHETLIKAVAALAKGEYKDILLKIAGDGEYRKALEELTGELKAGSNVDFLGMLPEQNLPAFLGSLNLYVHASLGETMSTAIMQAMACGLPVIGSDVKGISNMIRNDETGILVPVQNSQAMSNAIERLLKDETKRKALGAAARRYAEQNFSDQAMVTAYSELFDELTKTR